MKVLALVPDAFGGRGGIAKYDSDLLRCVASHPSVQEVAVVPRTCPEDVGRLPPKTRFYQEAGRGLSEFIRVSARLSLGSSFDTVICGHVNLLPFAYALAKRWNAQLGCMLYGIDVWTPPARRLTRTLISRVDLYISISSATRERFVAWSGVDSKAIRIVPNAIETAKYGPGPKSPELLDRYGLRGRSVIMTLARLSPQEDYKGFREIINALPRVAQRRPNVSYLIVGTGQAERDLRIHAQRHQVADRVVFAGYVDEAEKADHYRLADVFAMPGRGEGFGFVFLEAMACGVPVVASILDGSREAVRWGRLGAMVDPDDSDELTEALIAGIETEERQVPNGLSYFEFDKFENRIHVIVDELLKTSNR